MLIHSSRMHQFLLQVLGMFEFLKSTFKKFDGQKKKSEDKSATEDTQSSSQDEIIENRDIFVDPVIKKLKQAKVNAIATISMPCHA